MLSEALVRRGLHDARLRRHRSPAGAFDESEVAAEFYPVDDLRVPFMKNLGPGHPIADIGQCKHLMMPKHLSLLPVSAS